MRVGGGEVREDVFRCCVASDVVSLMGFETHEPNYVQSGNVIQAGNRMKSSKASCNWRQPPYQDARSNGRRVEAQPLGINSQRHQLG